MTISLDRRKLLISASAVAAVAVLDIPVLAATTGSADSASNIGAWIRIARDGSITLLQPQAEMGQGVNTSIAALIAEELEVDLKQVKVEFPVADIAFANKVYGFQTTAESTSIRAFFDKCRTVGAQARMLLVQAAAAKLGVDAGKLKADSGFVVDSASGKKLGYGELAEAASKLPAPENPPLKPKSDWRLIGKPLKRVDTAAKTNGAAIYGIDVKIPGMLVAAVQQCPVPGGTVKQVNEAPALAVTGVKKVVKLDSLVAVVADSYWQARKGLAALDIEWNRGAGDKFGTDNAFAQFRKALDEKPGAEVETVGDVATAFGSGARVISAEYSAPYLAHVTMEPQNATAHFAPDKLTLWLPTQAQGLAGLVVGPLVGLKPEQVECRTTFLGGGFGRRFELDAPIQAALISKAAQAPVKVIWSREEDLAHDFYRPGSVTRFEAAVDGAGKVVGLRTKIASPSILSRALPSAVKDGVDITSVDGIKGTDYSFGARRLTYSLENTPIPVGFWRSVAHSTNGWTIEGFVNELSSTLGEDPVAFRKKLLAGQERNLTVLNTLAEKSRWSEKTPGIFKGIAMHHSFDAVIGHVVEITMPKPGVVTLQKVTSVADVGVAVNPDIINAQLQSAVIDGLNAALFGVLDFKNGEAVQRNFDTYSMISMAQVPRQIDIHILQLGGSPSGLGEPGVPAVAPALIAAVNAATGKTIRSLPLVRQDLRIG